MYDVKPEINALLKDIPGVNVSDQFPASPSQTPHITFKEADNANYRNMSNEVQSEIIILIDIWHTKSTGSFAQQVDEKMTSIGFLRQFATDLNDPSGMKRKTMRYRGVVDKRTKMVHQ
ncbi:hypothetical protein [Psychrobacillus lasiicapitis]|uniref:DUF3168 domain-containing protein n=1 Tax=Psychrobacillus lasiicapitis TaxID=1636719 RepID=A0A544TA96_9BACI|nr:hypothetical protein [Psychrobacillus lasiicapitis]TQR14392.1 hypothetical protein FG382_08010 [Psychrobacillus lasiicapitis]GGA31733.1 hypothetical protein GCM10011384_21590 [Psychrobacillus lasiicapitis]